VNSRPADEGTAIRRRRECAACHRRFTSYERAQFEALMVRKRSGRLEAFNPDKLLDKLRIACNKRPATEKQLREFAYGFEDEVQVPEIASAEIGRRTLSLPEERSTTSPTSASCRSTATSTRSIASSRRSSSWATPASANG
jgi:transcriptional repressor NrdR